MKAKVEKGRVGKEVYLHAEMAITEEEKELAKKMIYVEERKADLEETRKRWDVDEEEFDPDFFECTWDELQLFLKPIRQEAKELRSDKSTWSYENAIERRK